MIPRFLLAAATLLLLTACAKDAVAPAAAPEVEADTAAIELHFHAISGLNPGANGEIDIFSLGADGQPDGDGVNADIGSWQL